MSHLPCKATCLITLISPFREDNYQVPKTIFTVVQNQYIFKKSPENKITVDYLFNTRALIKAFISEAVNFFINKISAIFEGLKTSLPMMKMRRFLYIFNLFSWKNSIQEELLQNCPIIKMSNFAKMHHQNWFCI